MGSKFQLILLDNVAEVIDSRHKTPNYTETGYPMVRVVDIKNGELDLKNTKRVTKDIYEDFSKGRSPQIGDLIISRVGSYGNISYVSKNEKFCLGQNTAFIIPNEKNSYLYYALISPFVQQQINDMAVGAVQKTISLKSIKNLKIPYPELNIRNIISKKLRVIDNRISTNDKINQTLEQMSQTLFKSWFVDFDPVIDNALEAGNPIPEALQSRAELRQKVRNSTDFKLLPTEIRSLFPSEFEETEFGWVPKGWQIKSLDHIANFQNGLALQKFRPNNMDDDYLPVLKIADLRAGQITNDERARTDISDSCKVYDGDMIFSWSGTLMIDIWTGGNAALNQHLYKVTSKKYPQSFYFMWTKQHLSRFQHIAEAKAVTMGHIKKEDLSNSLCLIPTSSLITKYDNIVGKYLAKIKNQRLLNNQMTNLRDTLLPKLISGELSLEDLPDLNTDTEAA
ncbi:restriction endonuclease subunit S [Escherichia coli]|nr:restriction endonuclease subunit S [Escherichia coli]